MIGHGDNLCLSCRLPIPDCRKRCWDCARLRSMELAQARSKLRRDAAAAARIGADLAAVAEAVAPHAVCWAGLGPPSASRAMAASSVAADAGRVREVPLGPGNRVVFRYRKTPRPPGAPRQPRKD